MSRASTPPPAPWPIASAATGCFARCRCARAGPLGVSISMVDIVGGLFLIWLAGVLLAVFNRAEGGGGRLAHTLFGGILLAEGVAMMAAVLMYTMAWHMDYAMKGSAHTMMLSMLYPW